MEIGSVIFDKVVQVAGDIAKTIPFAGTAIAALEGIIGICWKYYKELELNARVKAINLIINKKITTEDDISVIIGKLALQVTISRENEIKNYQEPKDSKVA